MPTVSVTKLRLINTHLKWAAFPMGQSVKLKLSVNLSMFFPLDTYIFHTLFHITYSFRFNLRPCSVNNQHIHCSYSISTIPSPGWLFPGITWSIECITGKHRNRMGYIAPIMPNGITNGTIHIVCPGATNIALWAILDVQQRVMNLWFQN